MNKIKKIALCGGLLIGGVFCCSFDSATVTSTSEIPTSIIATSEVITSTLEEIPASSETIELESSDTIELGEEEQGFVDKIENAWNDYLVPILSSVSVASVLSAIISIVFTFVNKKLNTKNKETLAETITTVSTLVLSTNKLIMEMKESNSLQDSTKEAFKEASTALITKVTELVKETEKLEKMKPILVSLANIQAKLASVDKEAVKVGITEEINRLLELVKQM